MSRTSSSATAAEATEPVSPLLSPPPLLSLCASEKLSRTQTLTPLGGGPGGVRTSRSEDAAGFEESSLLPLIAFVGVLSAPSSSPALLPDSTTFSPSFEASAPSTLFASLVGSTTDSPAVSFGKGEGGAARSTRAMTTFSANSSVSPREGSTMTTQKSASSSLFLALFSLAPPPPSLVEPSVMCTCTAGVGTQLLPLPPAPAPLPPSPLGSPVTKAGGRQGRSAIMFRGLRLLPPPVPPAPAPPGNSD
mmetsp:Transcript_40933/g.123466  ORF Transcript_40933/g.123466 Transcript_40933/m.123466 type:complete len:248 (-) Transcript_40933:609-1352(-)